jgi:hypothetical protein
MMMIFHVGRCTRDCLIGNEILIVQDHGQLASVSLTAHASEIKDSPFVELPCSTQRDKGKSEPIVEYMSNSLKGRF